MYNFSMGRTEALFQLYFDKLATDLQLNCFCMKHLMPRDYMYNDPLIGSQPV